MEGQNLAARLTPKISTITRHQQALAFSLRRGKRKPGSRQCYRTDIGYIERVVGRQGRNQKIASLHRIKCDEGAG